MMCEILYYKYDLTWNLTEFLKDEYFKSLIQPSFPLITSTMSPVEPNCRLENYKDYIAGKRRGKPKSLLSSTEHAVNTFVADQLNLNSISFNLLAACARSLYSFYIASQISLANNSPVIVFSGDNFLDGNFTMWMFNSYGAVSQESGLPFDNTSKGFRMNTGVSLFLIKHPSVKYNLDTIATIKNFYFYTNASLATHPGDAETIYQNFSNIDFKSIDLWNAHATGTPIGDIIEYEFFAKACKHDIPIIGYKGYVGHCMSASGAIELAMMLDDKQNNILKPNIIKGNKIVNDDRIITESQSFCYKKVIKTSFAFGGKTVVTEIDL